MRIDELNEVWARYRATEVDMTIHPADHMLDKGLDAYRYVGESGAAVMYSALSLAPTHGVNNILDFACGYGRVGRHIRAMFPQARLVFSDTREDGVRFCAEIFGGEVAPTSRDLAALTLPEGMDLIWVGSLFTHLDAVGMQHLFDALFRALAPRGIIVATFHGRRVIQTGELEARGMTREKWETIVNGYVHSGLGHQPYDGEIGAHGIGVSLTTPQRAMGLSDPHPDARPVAFMEQAWANFQDVCVWTRR